MRCFLPYIFKRNKICNCLPGSNFFIFKFTIFDFSDWALAMYGYLLEESDLNQSAEEAYKRCLDLLISQTGNCDDIDSLTVKIEKAQKDYARIL